MNPLNISLRPFRLTDADDIMSWAGDDQVTKTTRWRTLNSKEEALFFIREQCLPHQWHKSICIRDRSIGFLWVVPGLGPWKCSADREYALAREYWGQGIATEAVNIAISEVFEDFPEVVRLQAHALAENKASQRALEKAGFLREGLLRKSAYIGEDARDMVVYSFLATDAIPSAGIIVNGTSHVIL